MIFIMIFQPLCEGITSLILSLFELGKAHIAVAIHKCNQKVEENKELTRQIGFILNEEEEEEDDL